MPTRSRADAGVAILLGLIMVALISSVMLIPSLISVLYPTSPAGQPASTGSPTSSAALERARAILARVRDEVIPREGLATNYRVSFSDDGYNALVRWNEEFHVEPRYADAFESLDLHLPCCEWATPSRDEKSNCACGHHHALTGLSKKLLNDGQSPIAVQVEVSRWVRYMYPKEALAAEMEKRAQLDPEIKAALEELKARGEC